MDMNEYNLVDQLLMAQQQMPQGQGMLAPVSPTMPMNSSAGMQVTRQTKKPVQPQLAEPIVAAFAPRPKFPTSAEEFNSLIQRQTEGLAGQREGLKSIQAEIDALNAGGEKGTNWAPLLAISDLVSGTNYLPGYVSPEMKERARKEKSLGLKMNLQKAKNELTDKEIDLFKAQYQDALGREKLATETELAKMKIGAEAGRKFTPGQEAADKAFGKDYQDWNAQGGYASVEKQLAQLQGAINQLEANPELSGGMNTALPDAVRRRLYPEAMKIEQDVKQATQAALRQTLGSQFTEKEGEAIMQRSYDPALPAADNIAKIKAAILELQTKAQEKDRAAKHFEASGGTLSGYKPATMRKTEKPPSFEEWKKAKGM